MLENLPEVGWFEVISENYLGLSGKSGGRPLSINVSTYSRMMRLDDLTPELKCFGEWIAKGLVVDLTLRQP